MPARDLPRNTTVQNWGKLSPAQLEAFTEAFDMTWNVLAELTPLQGREKIRNDFVSAMKSAFLRRSVQKRPLGWFLSVANPPQIFLRSERHWRVEVVAVVMLLEVQVQFAIDLAPTDVFHHVMHEGMVVYETDHSSPLMPSSKDALPLLLVGTGAPVNPVVQLDAGIIPDPPADPFSTAHLTPEQIHGLAVALRSAVVDMMRVVHVGYEAGMLDSAITNARKALAAAQGG